MKFKIKKSKSPTQPYYWEIVAGNGQTLATSETYTTKANARSAAESVQAYAATATIVDET